MEGQFNLVFSSSAELLEESIPSHSLPFSGNGALRDAFLNALTEGDRERFADFCGETPDFSRMQGSVNIFRLSGSFEYSYALAAKKEGDPREAVYVSFFRNARRLSELMSPAYLRFFPSAAGVSAAEGLLYSPDSELIRKNAPTLTDMKTEHTDICELTENTVQTIREDAIFYGNRITSDLPTCSNNQKGEGDYILCFSTVPFVHVLYALCTALIEATVTHEISVSVRRSDSGATVELCTKTDPFKGKRVDRVTDLTCISDYAEYSVNLMAFMGLVAEINDFRPYVSYSPEDGVLSVGLNIGSRDVLEGEFRYREPYSNLSAMVSDAFRLWNVLTWKDKPLLDEEEQG